MPISDRSIKNQAMIIIKLVHDCWMFFSVAQVESVDLLIRTKTLEHSQQNCYPLFIHNLCSIAGNMLSTIYPLVFIHCPSNCVLSTIHPLGLSTNQKWLQFYG